MNEYVEANSESKMGWENKWNNEADEPYIVSYVSFEEGVEILLKEGFTKIDDTNYRRQTGEHFSQRDWAFFCSGKWFLN
jgi:hypothetical protein